MELNTLLHDTLIELATALKTRSLMLASAESCTGGMIAAACTDLPGSSEWFERGFVTYSNTAKTQMLGVPAALIEKHGAVSEAVARAMAQGAITHSAAQISLCTTGIAGPGGGSAAKPVGTVWIACQVDSAAHTTCLSLTGTRQSIREQATAQALQWLLHHVLQR